MGPFSGFGRPERRWGTAALGRCMAKDGLQKAIDRATDKSAREFFSPAFKVGAAGYGIAPQPTNGTYLLGDNGGLSGFGATCDWGDVDVLRSELQRLLNSRPNINAGLKVTATTIIANSRSGNCTGLANQLQQILDAVRADLRSQNGLAPLPITPGGDVIVSDTSGGTTGGDSDTPSTPSFFSNFYDNGKLTNLGIGAAVGGGLLVLAATTGVLGRALRKR